MTDSPVQATRGLHGRLPPDHMAKVQTSGYSAGEWTIDGGGGANDTVDYSQIDGVKRGENDSIILLPSGAVQHLINIEHIIGAAVDDELGGNGSDNVLIGGTGVDNLRGGGGVDVLIGGDGDDILCGDDDGNVADYLDGGAGADEFHVGEGDIVLNFNAGDKIYLNDVLLGGGENFSQWYDAPPGAEIRQLPFVDANGVAYTFVETGFGEGGAMAVMTAAMQAPVLIFGVDLTEDTGAVVRKVSGVEEGSYQSVELVAEGGFMRFTRWEGIDHHIPGFDPIPAVPQYAKDIYDWEDAGGVPGEFGRKATRGALSTLRRSARFSAATTGLPKRGTSSFC